jgi:ABC-type uncharacterized transport system permease subunit
MIELIAMVAGLIEAILSAQANEQWPAIAGFIATILVYVSLWSLDAIVRNLSKVKEWRYNSLGELLTSSVLCFVIESATPTINSDIAAVVAALVFISSIVVNRVLWEIIPKHYKELQARNS